MGRLTKVKRGVAVMHNATANVYYVHYTGTTKVCMGNDYMVIDVSVLNFNKYYTVIGAI
jgi:hypothetical protein